MKKNVFALVAIFMFLASSLSASNDKFEKEFSDTFFMLFNVYTQFLVLDENAKIKENNNPYEKASGFLLLLTPETIEKANSIENRYERACFVLNLIVDNRDRVDIFYKTMQLVYLKLGNEKK